MTIEAAKGRVAIWSRGFLAGDKINFRQLTGARDGVGE